MSTRVDNSQPLVLDRGAPPWKETLWYLTKVIFFLSALPYPRRLKLLLLRLFGAEVGEGVYIKPRVNIHMPWRLRIGDYAWIGEEVFVLNFESVDIGANSCISQRAFLCTGNHDYRDVHMGYRNKMIKIGDGAWVGAQVFVGPGVMIGDEAVITVGSVVTSDVPEGMVCGGNPCVPLRPRWK